MNKDMDKILLTGVCYVHRLLQLRYDQEKQIARRNYILDVHPDFDLNKVAFFRDDIAEKFLFTDFHGSFSSLETEATNLYELLRLYDRQCRLMYVVGATGIANVDLAQIMSPEDYKKLSVFWYFLFDESWNPSKVKEWGRYRDKMLLLLLKQFPKLKFIFYQKKCQRWWKENNLPSDRMIYWDIDWGMSQDDYEEIRQELIRQGKGGGHRFPTEDSYNELCDMILQDYRKS